MTITNEQIEKLGSPENTLKNNVLDWLEDQDDDYREDALEDLFNHGCQSGMVGHLIYYSDTCEFYNKHKEWIIDLALDQAGSFGYESVFELFAGLNGAKTVGDIDQVENLLAWYGFEEMARLIADELELEI